MGDGTVSGTTGACPPAPVRICGLRAGQNSNLTPKQGKPYYVPDKKHLLEYDDPLYCEDTPEKQKLRAFLKERCSLSSSAKPLFLKSFCTASVRSLFQ